MTIEEQVQTVLQNSLARATEELVQLQAGADPAAFFPIRQIVAEGQAAITMLREMEVQASGSLVTDFQQVLRSFAG